MTPRLGMASLASTHSLATGARVHHDVKPLCAQHASGVARVTGGGGSRAKQAAGGGVAFRRCSRRVDDQRVAQALRWRRVYTSLALSVLMPHLAAMFYQYTLQAW